MIIVFIYERRVERGFNFTRKFGIVGIKIWIYDSSIFLTSYVLDT